MYELTGDFPSRSELWEVSDEESFNRAVEQVGLERGTTVRRAVEGLMAERSVEWRLKGTTVDDLHLAVYALHAVMRGALLMGLLESSMGAVKRAVERWQVLWDGVATDMGEEGIRKCGLARHSPVLAWLLRRIIEISGDERVQGARYLGGVAHEGLEEVWELVKGLKDL